MIPYIIVLKTVILFEVIYTQKNFIIWKLFRHGVKKYYTDNILSLYGRVLYRKSMFCIKFYNRI